MKPGKILRNFTSKSSKLSQILKPFPFTSKNTLTRFFSTQTDRFLPPPLQKHPEGKTFESPLLGEGLKQDISNGQGFMPSSQFSTSPEYFNASSSFSTDFLKSGSVHFVKSCPPRVLAMDPSSVKAAIVTCGGLCPGLNVVIRELVMSLYYNYGTTQIFGILNGYKGFYTENSIVSLNPQKVSEIHTKGGTILKSSRGGWDLDRIAGTIDLHGFNQIFIIGGDGTHRGVTLLVNEMKKRGKFVAVVGIPKTIDNDIPIIDKSFGFDTAVEEAQRAIESANVEATSVDNGVGLVKLMGRNSGFIALHAALASRNVNLCLIPEAQYELLGKFGVYSYVISRLKVKGHAVVVLAEGAASGCKDEHLTTSGKDASGNSTLFDIANHFKEGLSRTAKSIGVDFTLKYLDPTYMIRSLPANSSDRVLCTTLAQSAVHGAFTGFTGFSVGTVSGQAVYIPVSLLTSICEGKSAIPGQRKVDTERDLNWWRLMASTGQPSFRSS
jgi:6-phosphofructokinase 1